MNELYRKLPKVDVLLKNEKLRELKDNLTYNDFVNLIKNEIEQFRTLIKDGKIVDIDINTVAESVLKTFENKSINKLQMVINGTGVIIHTNLGRSILNEKIAENIKNIAVSYNNLEYDILNGKRGNRNIHIEELLCHITGAESALVVNNNAAAVIICLNEFAKGKEVLVSRGELVEIGGSFRIPDIMELSGAFLKEVGTTNKTHIKDYIDGINENTALLLKVHKSNFKITGFTEDVKNEEISKIGKEYNLISMEDLGSGVFVDFSKYGVTKEPTVQESVQTGLDIITISGDKILGGPQCGIILGKKIFIDRLKKNQYLRAFRVDKLTLSALEMTLKYYLDEREAVKEIPTLKMITESLSVVLKKAEKLKSELEKEQIFVNIIESRAKIGGGAMPEETVPSYSIVFEGIAEKLEEKFRLGKPCILGRIENNHFLLDLKTIDEKDIELILERAKQIYKK